MTTSPVSPATSRAGAPSRVERKRTRKMREILVAAAEVLNRDGYHAMSLDEVAGRLDLTKATLYHYFGGKDELVSECLTLIAHEVVERLERIALTTAERPAPERLRRLLAEQLTILLLDYPQAARPFWQQRDWPREHRILLRRLREPHDALFRGIVEEGVARGELTASDPNVALHTIYGAMNYAPVWVRPGSRPSVERKIHEIATVLLAMISS